MKFLPALALAFSFTAFSLAQTPKADSLMNVVRTTSNDSIKQDARLQYIQELKNNYALVSGELFTGMQEAKDAHDFRLLGHFHCAAGIMYSQIGKNDSGLIYFQNSLNYRVFVKDTLGIASSNLGISNTYRNMGDFKSAIKYGLEAERVSLQVNDASGLARIYNALGLVFKQQQDYENALEYYARGIEQAALLNDEKMMSGLYSNIGGVYSELENYDSAVVYHRKALDLRLKNNDQMGLGISYGNFGLIFLDRKEFDSAFFYTNLALEKFTLFNYTGGIAMCYASLGNIWRTQGNNTQAIEAFNKAEKYARSGNFLPDLVGILKQSADTYRDLGKFRESTNYLYEYLSLKDSLFNEEKLKEVQKIQMESEYNQLKFADSLKTAEKEKIAALETEKQKQLNDEQAASFRIYMIGGAVVIGLGFVVLFVMYRANKKQKVYNQIIADQKATVEEKNKEITDSITYAKRIQEAILPPLHLVEKVFPQSFVWYKPKDIVAGDFYWLNHTDEEILIAAADCTGHGVPGAMVSVVCSNALNRTVNEFGIKAPGKILDKVRELVIETFSKSEKDVKDGMDISLLSIRSQPNADAHELEFSGANNPLWILRKDAPEFEEIKADKQPIGKYADQKPFTNHKVIVSKGDQVYFFTDGFQDQFGGDKGKKFKTSNLIKLLLSIRNRPMSEQRIAVNNSFEGWRGALEQVDDVCVIGIRF